MYIHDRRWAADFTFDVPRGQPGAKLDNFELRCSPFCYPVSTEGNRSWYAPKGHPDNMREVLMYYGAVHVLLVHE